jgi:hypothetical protein
MSVLYKLAGWDGLAKSMYWGACCYVLPADCACWRICCCACSVLWLLSFLGYACRSLPCYVLPLR